MPKFLRGLISNNTMVGGFVRGEPTAPTLELIDVDGDESMKALSYPNHGHPNPMAFCVESCSQSYHSLCGPKIFLL